MFKGSADVVKVDKHFSKANVYLSDNYNIILRREFVSECGKSISCRKILDLGCGDGSIGASLQHQSEKVVFVDQSTSMLHEVRKRLVNQTSSEVNIVHGSAEEYLLNTGEGYDTIICFGLLAHLREPISVLLQIAGRVELNGSLFIQNTDADHFYSKVNVVYRTLVKLVNRRAYNHSAIEKKQILALLESQGFTMIREYRYIQSLMFFSRVLTGRIKYMWTKNIFGVPGLPQRHAWGNEYLYHFVKYSD
jgi:2-polyprenyl-3-methyl-5-hydroxy-6-metoxy-1,4-benzoquinol methylase